MKLYRIMASLIFVVLLVSCARPTAEPQTIVVTKEDIKEVEKEGPIEIAVHRQDQQLQLWQNVQTGAFAAQAELKEKDAQALGHNSLALNPRATSTSR